MNYIHVCANVALSFTNVNHVKYYGPKSYYSRSTMTRRYIRLEEWGMRVKGMSVWESDTDLHVHQVGRLGIIMGVECIYMYVCGSRHGFMKNGCMRVEK